MRKNGVRPHLPEARRLGWSAERRLAFIDFRLYWQGRINRRDLIEFFAISQPQSAKDLRAYLERAPGNARYDARAKAYLATARFEPVFFEPDAATYFEHLTLMRAPEGGVGRSWLGKVPDFSVAPVVKRKVDPCILRALVRALGERCAITLRYQSMHEPRPRWGAVSPHALATDGFRWHVRGFCHREKRFRDFVLARVLDVRGAHAVYVGGAADDAWHESIDVILKPNPDLTPAQRRATALDYAMRRGRLVVTVRKALLFYFLTEMRLDFDPPAGRAGKPPRVHPLVVENRAAVARVLDAMRHP